MNRCIVRRIRVVTALLLVMIVLFGCGEHRPESKSLVGRWEGVCLTRKVDGQPPSLGTFERGGFTIEYFENGTYRVESRAAPDFDRDGTSKQPIAPLVFRGRFKLVGDHAIQMTITEIEAPAPGEMVGKTDEMTFVIDGASLVTFSPIVDQATGKRIGTMEASYRRAGAGDIAVSWLRRSSCAYRKDTATSSGDAALFSAYAQRNVILGGHCFVDRLATKPAGIMGSSISMKRC